MSESDDEVCPYTQRQWMAREINSLAPIVLQSPNTVEEEMASLIEQTKRKLRIGRLLVKEQEWILQALAEKVDQHDALNKESILLMEGVKVTPVFDRLVESFGFVKEKIA